MTPPLAARFVSWALPPLRAGTRSHAALVVENVGSAVWRKDVLASYHWLDERGNPIVWDGLRTPFPAPVAPGQRVAIELALRMPIPPGRYRLALDLVAEGRAWLAELGSASPQEEVEVLPRVEASSLAEVAVFHLPEWCQPAQGWEERALAAHADGYAVVTGAIDPPRRLRRVLSAWAPGPGRVPGFAHPLLCPSVLRGVELERLPDVHGLPAFRPPADEPWLYDGSLVIKARPPFGRRRG
ncbi:MAG: hypothetical protein C4306_03965 [Thermoleophilia bacterium]